jgi:hypothetical protein
MDVESIPFEPSVNQRIGLYEKGERNAIEWYDSYISAAWEVSDKIANLGLDVGDSIPFSVKVIVPEGARTSDDDRIHRKEFLERLDMVGINYSVVFVEEEAENPSMEEVSPSASALSPRDAPKRPHEADEPIEQLVEDFSRRRNEIKRDTEERRIELESRLSRGQIDRKQFETKKKELLKSENEALEELRKDLDRRLKGRARDDDSS